MLGRRPYADCGRGTPARMPCGDAAGPWRARDGGAGRKTAGRRRQDCGRILRASMGRAAHGCPCIITGALAAAMGGLLTLPFRTAITCTCARLVRDGVLPPPPLRTAMGVQARRLFGYRGPGPGAALPPPWPWARRLLPSPRLCGRTASSPAPASAPRHLCRAAGGDWPPWRDLPPWGFQLSLQGQKVG